MIHVKDNWYVDADKYCYQLKQQNGVNKQGEPNYTTYCYTNSIFSCLQKLLTLEQSELVENNDMTLDECIVEFKKLNNDMIQTFNNMKDSIEKLKEERNESKKA